MASGIYRNVVHGLVHGVKHNSLVYANGLASARDAASGIYTPSTNAEAQAVTVAAGLAYGAPTSIWLMQDASGGAVDVNGTNNLSAFGTLSFQRSIAGWTRKAIGAADGAVGAEIASVAASLPDVSTTSVLVIAFAALPTAPAASRTLMGLGNASYQTRVSTTPSYTIFAGGNSAAGAGNLGTGVHPFFLRHNQGASNILFGTDQEISNPTYDPAVTGKRIDFGGFDQAAADVGYLYAIMYTGAAANWTQAEIKAYLQTLGFSVAW